MELFAKQIINDLKPLQGLRLCNEKDIFAATANGALNTFNQNLWKTPMKELILFSG